MSVTDSAGVELVYSTRPLTSEWSVDANPVVEIRPEPSDSAALLYRVVGAAVLLDGGVAVANLGDNTVRLYAPTGELITKVGGSGEGPGEFRQIRGLVRRGSELWAFQALPHSANVFDLDGGYLGSVTMPPASGPRVHGFLADGSVVATIPHWTSRTASGTDSAIVIRFGPEGLDTIAVLPSLRRIAVDGIGAEAQALGPTLHVTAAGSLIYASFASDWDIGVWRDGRLARRIRRLAEAVPVERYHRDAYREALVREGGDDPRLVQAYRMLADNMVYPDHHPAHSRMLLDPSGLLWVERAQTEPPWSEAIDYARVPPHPASWDVFSTEGAWLSTVRLPARFRVLEIGDDYVAGVAKDDLDVEIIQVWRLRKID